MARSNSVLTESERRLPIQYSKYHPNFRKRRKQCLRLANDACLRCAVTNRTIAYNEAGPFVIYLHAAHVFADQKDDPDAPLIALCPRCHWHYDHPQSPEDWFFIGHVARMFLEEHSHLLERSST